MNKLSTERAIETLYTVRAYYASLTAGYPKGKDCKGIGDVMCSEIANSCLMAIKALEKESRWIPVSERLPEEMGTYMTTIDYGEHGLATGQRYYHGKGLKWNDECVVAWMPLPEPYKTESEEQRMTCDKCKYFEILYEPLRTRGTLWDMGRAKCGKHDLITDFANHRNFNRLDTCENYEPRESEENNERRTN